LAEAYLNRIQREELPKLQDLLPAQASFEQGLRRQHEKEKKLGLQPLGEQLQIEKLFSNELSFWKI
jgi:hypothetical protein